MKRIEAVLLTGRKVCGKSLLIDFFYKDEDSPHIFVYYMSKEGFQLKVTKEQFADKLVRLFPEKEQAFVQHYEDFGELLGHIFFSEEINVPLFDLLKKNDTGFEVSVYCRFIEEMWRNGTDDVVNIVDVTIAERLSDDNVVWNRFGKNISNEFKEYINNDLLINNIAMCGVAKLEI